MKLHAQQMFTIIVVVNLFSLSPHVIVSGHGLQAGAVCVCACGSEITRVGTTERLVGENGLISKSINTHAVVFEEVMS